MKKHIKSLLRIIKNVFVVIIILEITLGLIFNYNDRKRYNKKIQFIQQSGAYENISDESIENIYTDLYNIDTQWEPFVYFKFKKYNGKTVTIDTDGLRKTINSTLKDSLKVYKIFCFGGSTMFSVGSRDEYTIPSEISKLIKQAFPNLNFKIINFGCHGYSRVVENIQLQQQLLRNNKPNLVIFYDGVNEILSANQNNKVGMPANAINRKQEFKLAFWYSNKIKFILTTSNTKRFILYLQRRIFKTKSFKASNVNLSNDIEKDYINNINLTNALSEKFNFKVYNFLQPVIYSKEKLSKTELIMAKNNNYLKDLYINSYKNIGESIILKQDSTFIDISTVFNTQTKTIYTDFCHTAEKGNKLVALEIFKHISKTLDNNNALK